MKKEVDSKQEKVVSSPEKKPNMSAYKPTTLMDIINFKKHIKIEWWENMPILGSIIYGMRIREGIVNLDRPRLKKAILKWQVRFVFFTLLYLYIALSIVTPWLIFAHLNLAANEVQKQLKNENVEPKKD